MQLKHLKITFIVLLLLIIIPAETAPKYEFRAAWIATVLRLDWPSSSTVSTQKSQLITILNQMQQAGLNAAVFQIRPACDAFYESDIEPWSNWLTGTEGKAPNPYYDPLEFAVEEAHKRGIELHAWFNPYRAKKGASNGVTAEHVFNQHPDWILAVGSKHDGITDSWRPLDERGTDNIQEADYILNPGMAVVRDYVLGVILDVVNRYDIDGVHMDDYFYPYSGITTEDQATFNAENRGFTNIGDWRRDNVNLLIEAIYDSLKTVKPHVKLGMSPFGIWKSGVPSGIVGLSAYSTIYCDAVAWLDGKYIDYLTPQLYWPFGGGQDYGKLMPWWAQQARRNNRHLYTGNAPYRISADSWDAGELPRQIRLNRQTNTCLGNVYFRINYGVLNNPQGFLDSLKNYYYRLPALTPPMSWIDSLAPAPPTWVTIEEKSDRAIIRWGHDVPTKSAGDVYRHIIYKWRESVLPDFDIPDFVYTMTSSSDQDSVIDNDFGEYIYGVAALDRLNNESSVVTATGSAAQPVTSVPKTFQLVQNFPNPFNPATTFSFQLPQAEFVTLNIYNLQGQLVATLVNDFLAPGPHHIGWQAGHLKSGVYLYQLQVGELSRTRKCILMK
ncbi:MAG TPA: T9SS type A sorting domain-containing protein [Candidatus Marinimicrobia bacterium]|nr:T9SS type A sorting domain-containing protein [Candidatus Neomarinimicrobiota bacterium]